MSVLNPFLQRNKRWINHNKSKQYNKGSQSVWWCYKAHISIIITEYLWHPISRGLRVLKRPTDACIHIPCTHTLHRLPCMCTPPHTCMHVQREREQKIHVLLVMCWWKREGSSDQSVCRKEGLVGFQFWLERREWRGLSDRERKSILLFLDDMSDVLKGSSCPSSECIRSKYLRLSEESKRTS